MKICAISDLHGHLEFNIKDSDILCICGDVVPLKVQRSNEMSYFWFKNEFIPWIIKQPVKETFMIGGNHDFYLYLKLDEFRNMIKDLHIHYLLDEEYNYEGMRIYGTPWCHKFGKWAFMDYSESELDEIYNKIPGGLDIVLAHDCPYGFNDICLQDVPWNGGEKKHIGNKALLRAIRDRQPKYLLTGHLHTVSKEPILLGKTVVQNCSLLDEYYNLTYPPVYFEL